MTENREHEIPAPDAHPDWSRPLPERLPSSLSDLALCESQYQCSDRLLQQNRVFFGAFFEDPIKLSAVLPEESVVHAGKFQETCKVRQTPRPTAWPLVLAFGACLLAWGVVTSWIIFVLGVVLFAAGVAGWIAEMRHDTQE